MFRDVRHHTNVCFDTEKETKNINRICFRSWKPPSKSRVRLNQHATCIPSSMQACTHNSALSLQVLPLGKQFLNLHSRSTCARVHSSSSRRTPCVQPASAMAACGSFHTLVVVRVLLVPCLTTHLTACMLSGPPKFAFQRCLSVL